MQRNEQKGCASARDLVALHELEQVAVGRYISRINDANFSGEIFGGQYLGQSVAAAQMSAPGYKPQMLAGFFLRAARADRPLLFDVEDTRTGRRFAHRRVTCSQDDREVFRAEIALNVPMDGQPSHGVAMPSVPLPEELQSLKELARLHADSIGSVAMQRLTSKAGFDTLPLDPETGFVRKAERPAGRYWVRASAYHCDNPAMIDYSVLGYLSDAMANMSSRAMHVARAYDNSLTALSLNHCIWFHARPDPSQPFLFDFESCHTGGGVGSNRGLIFGRDGTLVASIAQDALIQWA